jgi:hypothetical protein
MFALSTEAAPAHFADRFVWISGWSLNKDEDTAEITKVLETAGQHDFNGVIADFDFDTLSRKSPAYFRRMQEIERCCDSNRLDLIPSIFSVGYGSVLAYDPNLAEGVPVTDAPFLVQGNEASLAEPNPVQFMNGGFEEYDGNKFLGFTSQTLPGTVSFVDTSVRHSGRTSVRLEHFTANPDGDGQMMQKVQLQPHRCYRMTLWVKTEDLHSPSRFIIHVQTAEKRHIAERKFGIQPTGDWRRLTMIFNSLDYHQVSVSAGMSGGKSGKLWLDDWSLEEVGPVNVLRRPGTPVMVRAENSSVYVEGKDYAPLVTPKLNPRHDDREAEPLKLLPGTRIHDGERLRVSWYHSVILNSSQVTICMGEPKLYDIFDEEAQLLIEKLHPKSVLLAMDEIRMGGTCQACRGRNMGQLLGECVTKEAAILRNYAPSLQIYSWADMLDPTFNARANYYLVAGEGFTGSWDHVPKDLIMAVWGGKPRPRSLQFFSSRDWRTLAACYYDADNLKGVEGWLKLASATPNFRGLMYTSWQKKYSLLPEFGDLIYNQPEQAGDADQ